MVRVTVAPARGEGELASLRRLLERYQAELPADLRVDDLEGELEELAQRYPPSSAELLLAHEDGEAAGCVIVHSLDALTLEIRRLYVEPKFRGSGAGRALMEAAIAFARTRPARRIVLDTERDHLRGAYKLYLSLGFVECAPYATAKYANPTYMELPLL
jgi:putative acetyltransferase